MRIIAVTVELIGLSLCVGLWLAILVVGVSVN